MFCLSESWTIACDLFYPLNNNDMFNFPRKNGRCGGIVIYVNITHSVIFKNLNLNVAVFEFSCIEIAVNLAKIPVACVYCPLHTNKDVFYKQLENLIFLLPSEPNSVVLCEDYNIDAFSDSSLYSNLVSSHLLINAYPVISQPTRVFQASSTLIDHIFTNFEHINASGVTSEAISDHWSSYTPLNYLSST